MNELSLAARSVFDDLGGFGLPVIYIAYKGLLLPWIYQIDRTNSGEENKGSSDSVRSGMLVLGVTALISLFFFLNVAATSLVVVMRQRPVWGIFTTLLGIGLLAQAGVFEWRHRQDNRYTDLLTDADERISTARQSRYKKVVLLSRVATVLWLALFAVLVWWLWRFSVAG